MFSHLIKKHQDCFVFFLFQILVLVFKFNTLEIPLFWDEILVYANSTFEILNNGLINTLMSPQLYFFHPPAINIIYATIMSIFEGNIFTIRIFTVFISATGLYFTYKIAKQFTNKLTAVICALIYFFTPEVFPQTSQMIADNFITTLILMSAYFAIREKFLFVFLIGLLIGLSRETGLAVIFITLPIAISSKFKIKNIFLSLAPVLSFLIFLLFIKSLTGSFTPQYAFQENDIGFSITSFLYQLNKNLNMGFLSHQKIYLTITCLLGFLYLFFKKILKQKTSLQAFINIKSNDVIFCCSSILYCLAFISALAFNTGSLPRYFNPIFPFLSLLTFIVIYKIHKLGPTILIPLLSITFYSDHFSTNNYATGVYHQNSNEYLEVIKLHQEAFDYIDKNFPSKTRIFSEWPLVEMASNKNFGWVNKNFDVVRKFESNKNFDILLWANNMTKEWANKSDVLDKYNVELMKRFQSNNKVFEIYKHKNQTIY